jgi:hypothetical protein
MGKIQKMLVTCLLSTLFIAGLATLLRIQAVQAHPPLRPLAMDREVSTTADSGAASLRQALLDSDPGDSISFNTTTFPPGSPVTITLGSALPNIITNNLTINASNAGVILDGSGTPGGTYGLIIDGASGVVIKGLQVVNFPVGGIWINNGASQNTIGGTNPTPTSGCSGDCNLISGNGATGISIEDTGTTSNTVSGNYIGTTVEGTVARGNTFSGIELANGTVGNVIGGTSTGERNLISGNNSEGVDIKNSGTTNNTIKGNFIGTNAAGTAAISNAFIGVKLSSGASFNVIGGDTASERNLISGNGSEGVWIIDSDTSNNVVSGNYIGTDVNGTARLDNENGVEISLGATDNIVGGSNGTPGVACTGECNLISGNSEWGVRVKDTGTTSNTISGNYIGTNVSGTAPISNARIGVEIGNGATNNIIGGTNPDPVISCSNDCNLISGNGSGNGGEAGVRLDGSGTTSNTVSGNYIGVDAAGSGALGNNLDGLFIANGAAYNTVGGGPADRPNLISGNFRVGVSINGQGSSATGNRVTGNYIGINRTGTGAVPNGTDDDYTAVEIYYAAGSVISTNVIAGNLGSGVVIQGDTATGNQVQGNLIGITPISATGSNLGNSHSGVRVENEASANTIGGSTPTERNWIGGNGESGISLSNSSFNVIKGNYVGTDISGTSALSNGEGGIYINSGSSHNVIGGSNGTPGGACMGECNLVSGNTGAGIGIFDSGTSNNTVSGNYIGTNAGGSGPIANSEAGVYIGENATFNMIGGSTAAERNLISGNSWQGISIYNNAMSNTVKGNYIGTNVTGTAAISNGYGVGIYLGAKFNTIGGSNATPGGSCSGECNLISGNGDDGVQVGDSGTASNTISGNYVGTDSSGTATLGNGRWGVVFYSDPQYQLVGGETTGERNLISGNYEGGVFLYGVSTISNTILNNYIGLDAAGIADLGNYGFGILLADGPSNNLIEANIVAHTRYYDDVVFGVGIHMYGSPAGNNNTFRRNRVYSNTNKGILLADGSNNGINRPLLTAVFTNAVGGTALANATIEIFSDNEDEGRYYHGTTTANTKGEFVFVQTEAFTGSKVSATATDANGNTSEFSVTLQGSGIFENSKQLTLGDLNSQACALGDFDIDGDQDAFCANSSPNEVWLNDGAGRFFLDQDDLGTATSQAVDVGDIDGDDDLDVVVGNAVGEANIIWLNNGSGIFNVSQVLTDSINDDTTAVVLESLDGDDLVDLVIGNGSDQRNEVWLNNGGGQLVPVPIPNFLSDTQAIAVGDLDNNNGPDIFVVNGSHQPDQIWFNNGDGTFSTVTDLADTGDGQGVALGYLDDQPGLDAVVVNGSDQYATLWLNNGSGKFMSSTLTVTSSNAVAVGDLDGDGDDDVVIGSDADQPNYVLINEGGGAFTRYVVPSITEADSQGVALGDLDNDGDLDTFVSNGDDNDGTNPESALTTNQVLINLNNQPAFIGPNGGTLRFSQGMTLTVEIPAGVLAENTIFNYAPLPSSSHPAPAGFSFAGRAFSLGGGSFNNTPVSATVYYNPLAFEGTRPQLHYWETEDGPNKDTWVDVASTCNPKSQYSYGDNWLKVAFCHLTDFGIFGGSGVNVHLPTILKRN